MPKKQPIDHDAILVQLVALYQRHVQALEQQARAIEEESRSRAAYEARLLAWCDKLDKDLVPFKTFAAEQLESARRAAAEAEERGFD